MYFENILLWNIFLECSIMVCLITSPQWQRSWLYDHMTTDFSHADPLLIFPLITMTLGSAGPWRLTRWVEVPKPQFRELPSLLSLPTLPQALISLHTPFFACLLLKEKPAGFNGCIYLVRRHQFGLMQNLCYHTGHLLMIFKEKKVC